MADPTQSNPIQDLSSLESMIGVLIQQQTNNDLNSESLTQSFNAAGKAIPIQPAASSTAYGYGAVAAADGCEAFGDYAESRQPNATAHGYHARAYGQSTVAVGANASAGSIYSVAIGAKSSASGQKSIAIGQGAIASGNGSIAMGNGAMATSANQAVFASEASFITDVYFGSGPASVISNQPVTIHGTEMSVQSNVGGGNLSIAGGRGRGTGAGGSITIKTAAAGSTGSSFNSLVARLSFDSAGNVIVGPAAIATNATDGFLYIDAGAGAPTGTPTTYTGRVPIYADSTNDDFYFFTNGAWHQTTGGSSASAGVPYFIASGDTFTVPLNIQSLFAMTIDNEGVMDVEGYLVEVD